MPPARHGSFRGALGQGSPPLLQRGGLLGAGRCGAGVLQADTALAGACPSAALPASPPVRGVRCLPRKIRPGAEGLGRGVRRAKLRALRGARRGRLRNGGVGLGNRAAQAGARPREHLWVSPAAANGVLKPVFWGGLV